MAAAVSDDLAPLSPDLPGEEAQTRAVDGGDPVSPLAAPAPSLCPEPRADSSGRTVDQQSAWDGRPTINCLLAL